MIGWIEPVMENSKLNLEIIKTNFQTTFQDIWIKSGATRVLTRFFFFQLL
jgi:hypothetical protein